MSKHLLEAVIARAKWHPEINRYFGKRQIRKVSTFGRWPRGANSPVLGFKVGGSLPITQGGERSGTIEERINIRGGIFIRIPKDEVLESGDARDKGIEELYAMVIEAFREKDVQNPLQQFYRHEYYRGAANDPADFLIDVDIIPISEATEFASGDERNPRMAEVTMQKIFELSYYRYRSL